MKIALQAPKDRRHDNGYWKTCLPFVANKRGVLIHRPRIVTLHKCGDYRTHYAVHNWCGNCATGTTKFTFLDAPPQGKLLCERCEAIAVAAGQPSAYQLCGRHVHVGGVVALQTCCGGNAETEGKA